jgi:D-alanyl-D-alanine carboxypeptidase (penicillin-binding protein 5/6)
LPRPSNGSRVPFVTLLVTLIVMRGLVGSAMATPGAPEEARPASAIDPPSVSADAIFSFDLASGVILYEKNPTKRMQVGSTLKVMTALVVMKYGNLEDEVRILKSDEVDIKRYSNMQLTAGDTLTVGTLLYGLLIPSGNDGANALARHVGSQISGSDDPGTATAAFVQAMNDLAAEIGLKNSRFANPSGVDAKNSYSSAQDIAILFGELMKNPKLAAIVAEPAYSFYSVGPEARQYQGQTTNQLLGQRGVIGGKTGTTPEAGGGVVFARQMNGGANTVITAVLGSDVTYDDMDMVVDDVRWDDARKILDDMDARFTWVVPGSEGTFPGLAEEMTVWQVEFKDPPAVPIPVDADTPMAYQLVLGPVAEAGEQCGAVRLLVGGNAVGSIPVYQRGAQAHMTDLLAWAA